MRWGALAASGGVKQLQRWASVPKPPDAWPNLPTLAFAVQMLPGQLVCGFVGISGRNEPRVLLPPAATAAKLDEFGKPAWIALIILGFMVWWPVGLATLAFIIGSGRVSCWKSVDVSRWHGVADQMRPAGTWLPSAKRNCRAICDTLDCPLPPLVVEEAEGR